MISFSSQQELEAYKKHRLEIADAWFAALGLGPRTKEMWDVSFPPNGWGGDYAAAFNGGKLILSGASGGGKTTLLKRILWGLCLRKLRPRGGYVPAMLDKLKSKGVSEYCEWLDDGDVLVLDDIDKIRATSYEGEKFLSMINTYDVNNRPILVTMNLEKLSTLKERLVGGQVPDDYAEAIISRLKNRATFFHVFGKDHREMV